MRAQHLASDSFVSGLKLLLCAGREYLPKDYKNSAIGFEFTNKSIDAKACKAIAYNTITLGNGFSESVVVGDGGVYKITTGVGNEDTVVAESGLKAGSSVTMKGAAGENRLFAVGDISGATLSGVNDVTGLAGQPVKVGAAQLSEPGLKIAPGMTIEAATGGTYNLAISGQSGDILEATVYTGTTLIANNAGSETLKASASGTDTLKAGSGGDTLVAGGGKDTLDGGNGYNTYKFGASFGRDTVNNAFGGNTTAKGEIDFTSSSVTDEKLWFVKSGDNLVVDLLGTSDQITISNWFGSAGAEVQTFNAGGLKLDTQTAQLVQAMTAYNRLIRVSIQPLQQQCQQTHLCKTRS